MRYIEEDESKRIRYSNQLAEIFDDCIAYSEYIRRYTKPKKEIDDEPESQNFEEWKEE